MKIDLTQPIYNEEGKSYLDEEKKELQLSTFVTRAILYSNEKTTAETKGKNFGIWYEKIKDKTTADLTSEEITAIKANIFEIYPTMVAGQCAMLLENKKLIIKK